METNAVHTPADTPFDAHRAERTELDTLLELGMSFTVAKRSLLRYAGKPERRFVIQQPYLGTLDYLSREFLLMDFDENRVQENPLGESKFLVAQNARRCARVVAISVLNSQWKIRLLTGLLATYFAWRITPAKLFKLTMLINTISNIGDFTNSIRFLSINRTTAPHRIEVPKD